MLTNLFCSCLWMPFRSNDNKFMCFYFQNIYWTLHNSFHLDNKRLEKIFLQFVWIWEKNGMHVVESSAGPNLFDTFRCHRTARCSKISRIETKSESKWWKKNSWNGMYRIKHPKELMPTWKVLSFKRLSATSTFSLCSRQLKLKKMLKCWHDFEESKHNRINYFSSVSQINR